MGRNGTGAGVALVLGAVTLLSACTSSIAGTAVPASPAGAPGGTGEDILAGSDPCSLLDGRAGELGATELGRDDEFGPSCVYQTEGAAYQLGVELRPAAELRGNPVGIGQLVDTTVGAAPAQERRHPTNAACTIVLEPNRTTVAVFGVSTVEGTQPQSCALARSAAELAVPVIRDRRFTEDTYEPPQDTDPCALLTPQQRSRLGVGELAVDEYGGCEGSYADGNQFTLSYSTPAAEANPGTGRLTDTTVAGEPAKEKRQPNNTYCAYILRPDEPQVVKVGAGGTPRFQQDGNCALAREAADVVSGNLR